MKKLFIPALLTLLMCGFTGCGGCSSGYNIGGNVLGLDEGEDIVLQMNLENDVDVTSNSSFLFSSPLADTTFYDVTIVAAPAGKTCTIANNEGYIAGEDITDVDVMCGTDTYTVGGTVIGLDLGGSLVLQNNKDDDLTVTADGDFTFATELADNAIYDVTILTNDSGKTCNVSKGKNMITSANVDNVTIVCHANSYNVGGTISGLPANKEIILQNNLQDNLTVTANGTFTFTTKIPQGGGYGVSVLKEPSNANCTVSSGAGTIAADVTNVAVTCVETPSLIMFRSSGRTSGLIGSFILADYFCDRDPLCPQQGTCKALIVDGDNRIAGGEDWVLEARHPYVRTDKTTEIGTTDANGIFTFPLTNAISDTGSYVWTGINADWTTSEYTCHKWLTQRSSIYGTAGVDDDVDATAISASDKACNYRSGYLYCVEQAD